MQKIFLLLVRSPGTSDVSLSPFWSPNPKPSLMGFGRNQFCPSIGSSEDLGRCLKIRDVCMDFEAYFKVHNLFSAHPKSIILGQMTNLNMVFLVMVSVYRFVKI